MALETGTRLGFYEIVALIGAGGMGEVYRARDTKLGREVALKVLPDQVARDSDRLARFGREAQVLATLNHPHIASIYRLEDSTGVPALVVLQGCQAPQSVALSSDATSSVTAAALRYSRAVHASRDVHVQTMRGRCHEHGVSWTGNTPQAAALQPDHEAAG